MTGFHMDEILQSNRTLDRIIASIGDLPASPAIVSTLMNLTSDLNTDIENICQVIMTDQSLSAKVLKLSNSSFYGRTKEVQTLKHAVLLLGFKTLRSLVVASSTHSLYHTLSDTKFRDSLWEHTLATALASRITAEAVRQPHVEEAFLAGLMHDIGKLVLSQKIFNDYRTVVDKVEAAQARFIDIEEKEFGFNHTDVGLLLLHKWAFPHILSNAVFEHHDPIEVDDQSVSLACIVNLANDLAKNLTIGFNDFRMHDLPHHPSALALGLDEEKLKLILDKLDEQFKAEKSLYQGTNL